MVREWSTNDIATNNIGDKELLSLFKKVNSLSNERKEIVKELIQAFVFKGEIQSKLTA